MIGRLVTILVGACLCVGPAATQPGSSKPNIVFIMADDLGYGDLGCYGCEDIRTPNLDRLAKEGVRLTDYYATSSTCSPTRAAFLTGRYPQRISLDNALYYQEFGRGLPTHGKTIARALKDAGYCTGLSGKWHLGYDRERQPRRQGFDHFFGLLGGNHHYFEHMDRIGVHDLWLNDETVKRDGYSTDLITDDAIAFMRRNQKHPFFLFIAHAAPHFPFQGPNDRNRLVKPKTKAWQAGDRETYIAMVEHMDRSIGRTLNEIDQLGLKDKTLVVFCSDNGGDVHSRNAPFSGHKSSIWEGGIRVPCIVRWPGQLPAGRESRLPSTTLDWTSTFRTFTGKPDVRDEGVNLLPLLKSGEFGQDRPLFWRRKSGPKRKVKNASRAVRLGDWKLLEMMDGEHHLFDLQRDPAERSNRIKQHPQLAQQLRRTLDQWENSIEKSLHEN